MGAPSGPSGGSGTGPQELGFTTRDKRSSKEKQKDGNVEVGLGKDRMSNYSTSQGGTKSDGGGVPDALVKIAKLDPTVAKMAAGPTTAEVSQSEAADADTEANRLLKIKKKGRSQSIITGSKGVTKTSTDYSLGKKSLLGRV